MKNMQPLFDHLSTMTADRWRASFRDIEALCGRPPLPKSAYKYSAWWSNDPTLGRQSWAWLEAGFVSSDLSLSRLEVTFVRNKRGPSPRAVDAREERQLSRQTKRAVEPTVLDPSTFSQNPPTAVERANTVVLVSCVKRKAGTARPAKDLYISTLFRFSRQVAELKGGRWFILSALYGLVKPETVIAPYEVTLKGTPAGQRQEWARRVFETFRQTVPPDIHIVLLAGRDYTGFLIPMMRDSGHQISDPLGGLSQGRRLAKLKTMITALAGETCG
jgi:hypothetical protein